MADNWPFKATCRMERIPNSPPVYCQRSKTAALAWTATRDCVCVPGECGGGGSGGDSNGIYLCSIYQMHQTF